ncbi:hypothetical protein DB30_05718 [Enhygromyxa salina]|uniref:Uncharacterized protein n=1 Tax=Enhygromyxa salina TaxID=215803 RepID=A0A0C2CW78_9BACT|nr:hypothetical protein [Enhygromyxa salina]KIG15291.1 hypothetical protein DB30_05718 [Enhygromyxa salina]
MSVIAPDNDAVIAAMLRLPTQAALWWLEQWTAREQWVDARFRARGGGWAIVRLVDGDHRVPAQLARRQTERFAIVALRSSVGADVSALLTALTATVAAHEHGFRWRQPLPRSPTPDAADLDPRSVSPERLAFEAGIKPALRIRLHAAEAPYEVGLWLRAGYAVAAVETDAGADGARTYVMVAPTRERALALVDAELRQYLPTAGQLVALRECGAMLGYPSCCVESFVRSTELEHDALDPEVNARRGNFHRIDAAWVERPLARLNTLLKNDHLGLLSFDPCRFDCPRALEIADRIASVVEAAHPGYTRRLLGTFAINQEDERATLELRPLADGSGDEQVRAATPASPGAAAFADRLIGHRVDAEGRIAGLEQPCRVFRFV